MIASLGNPNTEAVDTRTFEAALATITAQELTGLDRAIPFHSRIRLGAVSDQNWNVLAGDLPLPSLVLKQDELLHNITLMQRYCDDEGVLLCPHGKTTMAPQIFKLQVDAGAWGITVANVAQIEVCVQFGFRRILCANELATEYDASYLGSVVANSDVDLYVFVDSLASVALLREAVARSGSPRPIKVFAEVGMEAGRCGVRNLSDFERVASATSGAAPWLQLVGVAGFEGIVPGDSEQVRVAAVDRYLDTVASAVSACRELVTDEAMLITAGGSAYFDRVVERLGRVAFPDSRLILRSGGYVTHDSEFYEIRSPLGSRSGRNPTGSTLTPAIEVWAGVLSVPEAGLAILGMGRRDVPADVGYPIPALRCASDGQVRQLRGCEIAALNDQHAYLRYPLDVSLEVGELVGCGIQHPCPAFDRWRTMLVVDAERTVIDAIRTFF